MYSLVVLLSLITCTCFLQTFVFDRHQYRYGFGISLVLLLYTHNWTYFLGLALVIVTFLAWLAKPKASNERRALLRDAIVGYGIAIVLYLPWVPSFISQTLHTGAPWARVPRFHSLLHAPDLLLGGFAGTVAVLLVGGFGLNALLRATERRLDWSDPLSRDRRLRAAPRPVADQAQYQTRSRPAAARPAAP